MRGSKNLSKAQIATITISLLLWRSDELVYMLRIVLLSWGLYIMRRTGRKQGFGVA